MTAVYNSASNNHTAVTAAILSNSTAFINSRTWAGKFNEIADFNFIGLTPLMFNPYASITQILINYGANVSITDNLSYGTTGTRLGDTPMMYAAQNQFTTWYNSVGVIKLLVQAGLSPDIKNSRGMFNFFPLN